MLDSRHRGCYSPFTFNLQSLQLAREMNAMGMVDSNNTVSIITVAAPSIITVIISIITVMISIITAEAQEVIR
jgi:hypothetical protein